MDYYINGNMKEMYGINDWVINVQDAIVEEIFHDNSVSYVTISHGVLDEFDMVNMTQVRLVVDDSTFIRNNQGRSITSKDLRIGDIVDVSFSAAMTRSIPPQSRAFMITVVREQVNALPGSHFSNVVQDRIIEVDTNNNFIYTGDPHDIMNQIRFVVSNMTEIFDRSGNRIGLGDLRPGLMVRVQHADFMTLSIPAQTTAFRIWVL
ncbi:MAG: hypothetical protein GX321_10805 [Clostridiales bacterium]|nr:hypothetical protein [Clostridiales bacterium]